MSILLMIILVSVAGGVLSVLAAAFVALKARAAWVPILISYAIGALLGAVFLEVLPHALQLSSSLEAMSATVLVGILLFFILEKLVLWRHHHGKVGEVHEGQSNQGHDHGRSGLMIMIGDTFHNFVDGILIAAAFLVDVRLGFVTAIAIIAHEIPQEVGDFLILMHSGYTKQQALLFNLLSSMATLAGALGAYFALSLVQHWVPTILGLAAASMIYVAVADLIPSLHRRTELQATWQQIGLIGLGVSSIWLAGELADRI